MRKISFLFTGALLSMIILTGCGTSDKEDTANDSTPQETESNQSSDETKNGSSTDSSNETDSSDKTTEKEEDATKEKVEDTEKEKVRILEQNIDYSVNGENKQNTAFLNTSDNQHFTMFVLPEYELSAEEPMKDVLLLSGKEDVFMRIEILPADINWDETEENAKAQLGSVSESIETLNAGDFSIPNGSIFEAKNGNDVVTSVLIKDKNNPARLTLFTTKDEDHRDPFIKMASTIIKQ
ncbi:hypothetical protein MHI18_17860 [Peribacillus sp. FSL H8-0477]|uniref:hypothetical protein n=1 Tax=Peribacillus sp. FSL H8-0477 TaxID=2921388 RepID=UPI0030F5B630